MIYMSGTPQNQNLFIKNCVFIFTCLKFSHLQSTLHLIQYWDIFSNYSKQFLNLLILMPFNASAVFCFTSWSTSANIPLWGLFSSEETKKVPQGKIGWIGRVGHGVLPFSVKSCWTLSSVGRCAPKSPIMKWANALQEFSEKFTEAKCSLSQQCQLVHWYGWDPRTLT